MAKARRAGENRDRGATGIEYVALLLISAVVVAVAGTVVVTSLPPKVCDSFARLFSSDGCGGGDDNGGGVPAVPVTQGPTAGPSGPQEPDKDDYYGRICEELKLDCGHWDTSRGLSCNDHNIVPVYEYYAKLSREHPELQWAGMAKLAGGLVYAGMQDLHVLRKLDRDARRIFLKKAMPDIPTVLLDALAGAAEAELEYFEDKFVDMQKQIFRDLGWQHAAYVNGGIAEMRRLSAAGQLPAGMIDAWEDIASGDPERISRGNKELLYREQRIVLQDDYDDMKGHHGLIGLAVTYMLSYTAESPVPGGLPFRKVVNTRVGTPERVCTPWGWCQDIPSVGVRLPKNIADFDSRWKWITEDMLPKYQDLLKDKDGKVRREIDQPLGERAKDYRLIPIGYNPKDGVC